MKRRILGGLLTLALCLGLLPVGAWADDPGLMDSDYNAVIEAAAKTQFAYYYPIVTENETDDQKHAAKEAMKTHLVAEMTEKKLYDFKDEQGNSVDKTFEAVFGNNFDLAGKTSLGERQAASNSNALNLPYYEFTITLKEAVVADAEQHIDEQTAIMATGKVYVLEHNNDFVIDTVSGENHTYTVVQANAESRIVKVSGTGAVVNIFGNCTMAAGGLDTNSENLYGAHVTQEHSGLTEENAAGIAINISLRLFVVNDNYKGFEITYAKTAAAWDFGYSPYCDTGTSSGSKKADVFYANTDVKIKSDGVSGTISSVALDTTRVPAAAANITVSEGVYTVAIATNYDEIPLVITYDDSVTRYVTLSRIGLSIKPEHIREGKYELIHGTDHNVSYASSVGSGEPIAVFATFYYDKDSTESGGSANALASGYSDITKVNLFVTIRSGSTVTRRVVSASVTESGTAGNYRGYAAQGDYHYYDDFVIWLGSESDFENIVSISVFAFIPGAEGSFGGAKVGSGAGVEWTP